MDGLVDGASGDLRGHASLQRQRSTSPLLAKDTIFFSMSHFTLLNIEKIAFTILVKRVP